jgi:protein-L-isoaspartate(D-aspartate) O-methyltransferase
MSRPSGVAEESGQAIAARNVLVDRLLATGMIRSAEVEAAFRAVPREMFTPAETPLEAVYNADDSVVTKRDDEGAAISSVSAPFIQALMIEQAAIRPGMNVLEVGSGGYNAALLAEVVGKDGSVVSVDIDAEIADRARSGLENAGYGERVEVIVADGTQGVAGRAPFDRIVVTVGAWDIAPAWLEQLTEGGRLVLPLRMNGVTRSIAFRREGDHLVSTSAEVCGFVPMQGGGAHQDRVLEVTNPAGGLVRLVFDSGAPGDTAGLDDALATGRIAVWSGVTVANGESFADLHLWFAGHLAGFCRLAVGGDGELVEAGQRRFPFAVVRGDSFAFLTLRLDVGDSDEFGATAYGPHAAQAATAMVEQIRAWDERARRGEEPSFAFWPPETPAERLPPGAAVLAKTHGLLTISWPQAG